MARRTKEEAQATREALLDAAERVFARRGFSRTSLGEIAQEAGLTRGALYWHFQDKVALFAAMMDRAVQPLQANLATLEAHTAADADLIEVLLQAMGRALGQIAHDEQTRRVLTIANFMVEHGDELGALRTHRAEHHGQQAALIARVLAEGARRRGVAPRVPAEALGRAVHALVVGLVQDWLLAPQFDLQATALTTLRALLAGAGLDAPSPDRG